MASASKMSVLKRKREREKAEKAARKREIRDMGGEPKAHEPHDGTPSEDDLEGYGMVMEPDEEEEEGDQA